MQQNNKDYEDYLCAIEKSLNQENKRSNDSVRGTVQKKPQKKVKINYKAIFYLAVSLLLVIALIVGIVLSVRSCGSSKSEPEVSATEKTESNIKVEPEKINLFPSYKNDETIVDSEIKGKSIIFIDDAKNEVIASREPKTKMFPASTTKIMTLLVAIENIKDYKDTFKMTYDITDPLYNEGATVAGFLSGEVVNMYDLIYGTILPSGGDACIALAQKISGSEEAFVELMNKKAKELGLKNTHFTNCTGLHDPNHYTTAEDLSVILRAAMRNKICKKVLSTYKYTTSKTEQHSEGIELENTLFKYMYGTEPEGATILGGKTGFTNESGYCIATFGENDNGDVFVCVVLSGESRWPTVYDQINLYTKYAKKGEMLK